MVRRRALIGVPVDFVSSVFKIFHIFWHNCIKCVRDINASLNWCGLNCKITGRYFGDTENGSYQKNASATKMEFNKGDLHIITDSFLLCENLVSRNTLCTLLFSFRYLYMLLLILHSVALQSAWRICLDSFTTPLNRYVLQ